MRAMYAGTFGDRDRTARVEEVERMVRLQDLVVGGQRQTELDERAGLLLVLAERA